MATEISIVWIFRLIARYFKRHIAVRAIKVFCLFISVENIQTMVKIDWLDYWPVWSLFLITIWQDASSTPRETDSNEEPFSTLLFIKGTEQKKLSLEDFRNDLIRQEETIISYRYDHGTSQIIWSTSTSFFCVTLFERQQLTKLFKK